MRSGEEIGGRFVLGRVVGTGGMGMVFEAVDRSSGQTVALKVTHGQTPVDRQRFAREVAVLDRIAHPAVVGYVDHGETPDGRCFLAMEWLEGEDLLGRLRRAPLSLAETLVLAKRLLGGLVALHAAGVIHRDLKPGNVRLLDSDVARAKLMDLGVARVSSTRFDLTAMTAPGAIVGTPAYLAPEQARGAAVDGRTDLFSLGVVLWECLTHERAFKGEEVMAVLARVLFDPLPLLTERVSGLPPKLGDLVAKMTAKEPDRRPASAAEVLAAVEAIEGQGLPSRITRGRLSVLTPFEMRVVTAVVVTPDDDQEAGTDATWLPDQARRGLERLGPSAERFGLRLDAFPDGTMIAVVDGTRGPSDGANRAARFARAAVTVSPGSQVVVSTGRVLTDKLPVGEAVERASTLLTRASAGRVLLDELTADLVDDVFEVVRAEGVILLGDERPSSIVRAVPRSGCVGRARELALLRATLEECAAEPCARAVLVTGEPGLGKTRLATELLEDHDRPLVVARGRADPMGHGAPYGLMAPIVRDLLGVEHLDRLEAARAHILGRVTASFGDDARRVAAMLGELAGIPFADDAAPGLAELRADARALGDLLRASFVQYVAALSEERPILFLLDDLQWADRASVDLLDACLRVLPEHPITVLALARPEVDDRFGRLFEGRDVARLQLSPLSRRAAARLIDQLGLGLDADAVDRIVERAEGNPFFASELARAAGRGDALPATVLASVQARLDDLAPQARLVLRAASVLGPRFQRGAVEALVGAERQGIDVVGWLSALEHAGIVDRVARGGLEQSDEHAFRNGLVREACYAMLTPEDRRRGHRNAARWLEEHSSADPVALAFHFEVAGEGAAAAPHRAAAARRALEASDLDGVLAHVAELAPEADTDVRARARVIEGEARVWRGEAARAREVALEALEALAPASPEWLQAVSVLLDAAGLLGSAEHVERHLDPLLARSPSDAADQRQLALTLARAATPLLFLDRSDLATPVVARAAELARGLPSVDPLLAAWLAENRAMRAVAAGDLVGAVDAFSEAVRRFDEAGGGRRAASQRVNLGSKLLELGDPAGARAQLEAAIAFADAADDRYTGAFARLVLGLALAQSGDHARALTVQREASSRLAAQGDARLESASHSALAEVLIALGRHEHAWIEASAAVALVADAVAPRAAALAVQARLLLERGEPQRALAVAEEARVLADVEPMLDRERYLDWVHAWALTACGRPDARARAADAWAKVEQTAASIADPAIRRRYLDGLPEHRGLAALLAGAP